MRGHRLTNRRAAPVVPRSSLSFECVRRMPRPTREILAAIADVGRWSEFRGYGPLPGIEKAEYRERSPDMVGSLIAVRTRDGARHFERILEWSDERVVAELSDFSPPVSHFAERFFETWTFEPAVNGTRVRRRFDLFPRGVSGRAFLLTVSFLMKNAVARHLEEMSRD